MVQKDPDFTMLAFFFFFHVDGIIIIVIDEFIGRYIFTVRGRH